MVSPLAVRARFKRHGSEITAARLDATPALAGPATTGQQQLVSRNPGFVHHLDRHMPTAPSPHPARMITRDPELHLFPGGNPHPVTAAGGPGRSASASRASSAKGGNTSSMASTCSSALAYAVS